MELAKARAECTDPDGAMGQHERDRALAARIALGDVSAFAALLEAYWEPLVRYASRKLESIDAAEDAVQETFIRLWETRARLKPTASPRGYLYRVVHNLAVDELRKRGVRANQRTSALPGPLSPPTPAQIVQADELGDAAARAIAALPERRRDVFVLAHFHDLSYKQIADVLGITPRTVANHMTLGLRELRQALQPFVDRKLGPLR